MIKINNSIMSVCIDEEGAQLKSIYGFNTEYLWNRNPDFWKRSAPVLFPFVGRLKDTQYYYKGKQYGPMPIHGFVPSSVFEISEKSASKAVMKLVSNNETKNIYPFDFEFSVTFEIKDSTLNIEYAVRNTGKEIMYYGIGSHPGFNVPLEKGLAFSDYTINFPEAKKIIRNEMSSNGLNTHRQTSIRDNEFILTHSLFDNDAIIMSNTGDTAVLSSKNGRRSVTVSYPDTRYCAIWHSVKKEAPFVCIEPWTTLPGNEGTTELTEKEDFNILEPSLTKTHKLSITIA